MCVRTIARIVFAAFLVAGPVLFAKGDEPQNVSAKAGSPTIDLAFAGDIMLAELPGEMIARGEDPFSSFAEVLRKVDLAIGNLECVVATGGTEYDKPYVFRAHPRVLKTVKRHLDIVCLANNHTGDYGHSAFLEQLDLLEQHQLLYVGGGRNCAQARKPLLIDHQGFRIALLAYNDFKPRAFEAGPSWPGVAWAVDAQIVADIEAARTIHKADLVIRCCTGVGNTNRPTNVKRRWLVS